MENQRKNALIVTSKVKAVNLNYFQLNQKKIEKMSLHLNVSQQDTFSQHINLSQILAENKLFLALLLINSDND